jgi:hypothetical protein
MTPGRVGTHADVPSEVEPASLDDLVADCAAVRALPGWPARSGVPVQARPLAIPESALALVAGLDTYGD